MSKARAKSKKTATTFPFQLTLACLSPGVKAIDSRMKSGTWKYSPKKSQVPFANANTDWSTWSESDSENDSDNEEASTIITLDIPLPEISNLDIDSNSKEGSPISPIIQQSLGLRERRTSTGVRVITEKDCEDTVSKESGSTLQSNQNVTEATKKESPVTEKATLAVTTPTRNAETTTPSTTSNSSRSNNQTSSKADTTLAKTPPSTPVARAVVRKPLTRRPSLGRQQSMTASNRLEVGVKMKVKLEFIDDVSHEMNALVYLSLHYEDEAALKFVTNQPGFSILDPEKEEIFVPVVNFLDTRVCEHIEGFRVLVNTETGIVFIYRIYRIVFRSIMNLKRFPFDRQVMKCHIKSFTAKFKPWSAPVATIPSGISSDIIWRDNDCVVECDCTLWDVSWVTGCANVNTQPSVYKLDFGISRISLFYVVNFFLITFLVVIASISCTIIHFTDFASRSSITFTVLLTIISFKFIMANYTPTINYLTLLDYYNITGTILIIMVIFQNFTIAHYPEDSEFAAQMDYILLYYGGSAWIIFHMVLFVGSFAGWFYEDWKGVISSSNDMMSDIQRVHNKEVTST